jgi:iron complex transport system substrate-binding protein
LGREGGESARISWPELAAYAPEVLVMMPCGFNLQQTMKHIGEHFGPYASSKTPESDLFFDLPAVRAGRVYAVDANSYFARPGLRVVEGTELLAHLIHPEVFGWQGPDDAFQKVDVSLMQGSFEAGKDYYQEGQAIVFTASYLQRRGYCCNSGCRHCPY